MSHLTLEQNGNLVFRKTNKSAKIPYTLIAQLRFLPRVVNSRFASCTMVCEDSGTFLI